MDPRTQPLVGPMPIDAGPDCAEAALMIALLAGLQKIDRALRERAPVIFGFTQTEEC